MKKKTFHGFTRALCALLCAVLVVLQLPTVISDAASTSSEIKNIEKKLEEIEKKQQEYEDKLDSLSSDTASALETKSSYETQISVTEQKISSTTELIAQYDVLIAEAEAQIAGKSDEIDAKFEEFLERVRVSYEDGFVNYLVLILESESLTDLMMNTERTADILEYERSLMNSLEAEKGTLEESKASLEAARAAQQEAKAALDADKKGLEEKRSELDSYITSLENDTAKYEQMLDEAIEADAALNKELEKALAALAEQEKQAQQSGGSTVQHPVSGGVLIWPVGIEYNVVSSPYGNRTVNGRPDFHNAVDIPAPAGSPVYAAQAGTVVYSQYHYSYGNYVVINHGGGYTTLYAHNTSNAVSVGQTVTQGQVIGYVGQTGSAYGNHCHFEVRLNGVAQNPMNYLTKP